MTRPERSLAAVAVLVGATAGTCEEYAPVLSSDVATGDMSLSLEVTAMVDAAAVEARLVGPGGVVRLVDADRLTVGAEGGAAPRALSRGYGGIYEVEIREAADALWLRLERDPPAESVEVMLPLPPATVLEGPPSFSRGEGLTVRWEPAPGEQQTVLEIVADCFRGASRTLQPDPGIYTFQAADFEPSTRSCPATVRLRRTNPVHPVTPLREASGLVVREVSLQVESNP